jgi:hypothetical protein
MVPVIRLLARSACLARLSGITKEAIDSPSTVAAG